MDRLINSTKGFEDDLSKLNEKDRIKTIQKINQCVQNFSTQKSSNTLEYLKKFSKIKDYKSSLYVLKIANNLRVIIAIDPDPIFGQIIFTLFRVVSHNDLDRTYESLIKSLYQEFI